MFDHSYAALAAEPESVKGVCMSTDEGAARQGELTAGQEENLVEAMLRHQVGIDPDHVGAVLDLAAVGLVNSAWRNSPVEDWHAGDGPLSDGDMLRINAHTTLCLPITPSMQVEAVRSVRGGGAREYDCRSAASSADTA
ncbi:hypothetical protein [Saccharothrix stipae]